MERLQLLLQDYEERASPRPLPYCAEVTQTFPLKATIGDARAEPREVPSIDHTEVTPPESFPEIAVPDRVPNLTGAPDKEGYKAEAQTVQSWVNVCQELFEFSEFFFMSWKDQEKIPEEERATTDSYSPNGNLVNYWSIPFSRINYFALHCQIIKGRLTPSALKPILKGLALHLRMSNIATTHNHHATSPMKTHGMGAVLQGLQNAATDLGEEGGEILELLKVFREAHSIVNPEGEVHESKSSDYASPIYNCYDQDACLPL